ncbi:M67 family metallopeptidase [Elioraea sp. Yellowstone]|uniref:M67 family metallopeptidase n=1 Tax=Elioraea sp. Yellowstone TaxID=2592070 RepID=UPI00192A59CE|nr:M67 family metallopeptidase [Elioraea sp. Yellowstone]
MIVAVASDVLAALPRLAAAALPREACGLLVGRAVAHGVVVTGLAPSRNLAAPEDAFEIDAALQLALQRRLRGTAEAVVGVWHSHPAGTPTPSARDAAGAWEAGLAWLITAGEQTTAWRALGDGKGFARAELAR